MKRLIVLVTSSLLTNACYSSYAPNETIKLVTQATPTPATPVAAKPISVDYLAFSIESKKYEETSRKARRIKDAYARIIKFPENQELIHFSTAFFNGLSISEDLDRESILLPEDTQYDLPNANRLKFSYKAERDLNDVIGTFSKFINSPHQKIKQHAAEAVNYLQSQKEFFVAIREIDYRQLTEIPPEILLANAKLLEQQDRTFDLFHNFYSELSDPQSELRISFK